MPDGDPIRVLIVDDHAMVRTGLRYFVLCCADFELVGEAANGAQAVEMCADLQPDVVLMDLVMPVMDGLEATRAIRTQWSNIRVIALTSFNEHDRVFAAIEAGASGYLYKDISVDELAAAVRAAHAGRRPLAPEATEVLVQAVTQPRAPNYGLSPREWEVLGLLVDGLSNSQIAERLVISPATAKFHVRNIFSKLGVSNRAEAIALAWQHHLITGRQGEQNRR
jgi:NarL family two-component system response regulator LiaR